MKRLILIALVGLICMASGGDGEKLRLKNVTHSQIEGKSWRLKAVFLDTDTGSLDVFGDSEIGMMYLDKNGNVLVKDHNEKLYAKWEVRDGSVAFHSPKLKTTDYNRAELVRKLASSMEDREEVYSFYQEGKDLVFDHVETIREVDYDFRIVFEEALFEIVDYQGVDYEDLLLGRRVFKRNCAVCHTTSTKYLTAPGLANIMDRVPSEEWLYSFIKNNMKLIKAGDPYAVKIYNENNKLPMPTFEHLSNKELNAVIEYIKNPSESN